MIKKIIVKPQEYFRAGTNDYVCFRKKELNELISNFQNSLRDSELFEEQLEQLKTKKG